MGSTKEDSISKNETFISEVTNVESHVSYEEGNIVNYEDYESVPPMPKGPTGEFYYQSYGYVKPTESAFERKEVDKSKLFESKESQLLEDLPEQEEPVKDASILITGFGMRNVDSFQRILHMSRQEREKWELRKLWRDRFSEDQRLKLGELKGKRRSSARTESSATSATVRKPSSDFLTQTDTDTYKKKERQDRMKHLDYLLGLEQEMAEEEAEPFQPGKFEQEPEPPFTYRVSKSHRDADRYLRTHRIFECFQFIVTHLLSANPDNPIEFILNLLNRCLLYRSGLGEAPLLYERKHISKLFDLMDRWQTGYIDLEQYVAGMKTYGICSFNETPEANRDGLISRETFVEEVYEAELAIFNDLIKKRVEKKAGKPKKESQILQSVSVPSLSPPYFIPSDLFKSLQRHEVVQKLTMPAEDSEEYEE